MTTRTPPSLGCVLVAALCSAAAPACSSFESAPTTQTSAAPATGSGGTTGGNDGADGDDDDGGSGDDDGTAGPGDGQGSADAETAGADAGEATAGSGDTAGEGVCDPPSVPFSEQASVSMDPTAGTCAVAEGMGTDPQLVFDIRQTGLIDLTAIGLTISTASSGTYIDSTHVVGISPEFAVTVEGMIDGGGSVTIEFEILQTGPVLFAEVIFG